jgi:CRP-like cAMP-binding protein
MRLHHDAKLDLLRRVPLFADCSARELEEIGGIADELDLPAGERLIEEGRRGREFFALVEGSVDVTRGQEHVRTLGSGDFFGEIALVSDVPRTATVTTTSPVRLLVVTDRAFRRLVVEHPDIGVKVRAALAARTGEDSV